VGKQKKDITNPKIFLPVDCNFNFSEDRIEFILDIHNDELKNINIQKPTVHFKFSTFKPVDVPIITNVQKSVNRVSTISIHANFKDRLLHLFNAGQKEFLLTVFYTTKDKKKYATAFSVSLPKIENQNERSQVRKFIEDYYPEDLACGIALKRLFEKDFNSYSRITKNEMDILQSLKKYKAATVKVRFNNFNFLDMFQNMIAIEDLECIKETRGHGLDNVKVCRYNNSDENMKNVIKLRLGDKMSDDDYTKKIHVIKTNKKLPIDIKDFCAVYVSIKILLKISVISLFEIHNFKNFQKYFDRYFSNIYWPVFINGNFCTYLRSLSIFMLINV